MGGRKKGKREGRNKGGREFWEEEKEGGRQRRGGKVN